MDLSSLPKPLVNIERLKCNAYVLLSIASTALFRSGWKEEQIRFFQKEARSKDLEYLIQTVETYTTSADDSMQFIQNNENDECISCGEPSSNDELYCDTCAVYEVEAG